MHDIVHELSIATPPAQVFEALTSPAGLARWLTSVDGTGAEVGAVATFALEGGDEPLQVQVEMLEAPELVQWTCTAGPDEWVGTKIAFRIEGIDTNDDGEPDGGSSVRLWHGEWAYENGLLPRASFQWAMDLARLRDALESPA